MYNSAIAVLKGIRTEFAKQLADYSGPLFTPFVTSVNSDTLTEDYMFRDTAGKITEWKGKRTRQDFKDYLQTIRNVSYEFTIDVDRDTLSDSKKTLGGQIENNIREASQLWKGFQDDKVNDLIVDNGTAYDGSTFFANTHNIDGTNAIDNLYTGTSTSLAQIEADLSGAKVQARGFRDKNDRPFNRNPNWVVLCPSHLEDLFLTLKSSQQVYISGTKTNIYQNTFDIIINDWQPSSNDDWYLINTNAVVNPFIVQNRKKPDWNVKDDIENKDILYMSDARLGFGYGTFTSIIKIDN